MSVATTPAGFLGSQKRIDTSFLFYPYSYYYQRQTNFNSDLSNEDWARPHMISSYI